MNLHQARIFTINEIEHHGDLDHAISGLAKAGYTQIEVLSKDFDGECATFSAIPPPNKTDAEITAILDEEGVCF